MGNISSLAHQLADKHLMGEKAAEGFIKSFFSVLMDGLHQDKAVKVRGLGTFKVTRVAPRESVDVNTGERIVIEGRDKITFTPDATLRDWVNRPFAQFETVTVNDDVDFDAVDRKFASDSSGAVAELLGEAAGKASGASGVSEPSEVSESSESSEPSEPSEPQPRTSRRMDEAKLMEELRKSNRKVRVLSVMMGIVAALVVALVVVSVIEWEGFHLREKKTLPVTVSEGIVVPLHPAEKGDSSRGHASPASSHAPSAQEHVQRETPKAQPDNRRTPQPAPKATPKAEKTFSDYVDNVRVRTGAYTITGIDRTVTLKSGQTLQGLSRTYLGPGMECYIEAVNGGRADFKAGEKIRIPSLKMKRRRK
ncbi:MAG: HU family DNA-binding protein [Prevotella sp.]|nr:HU family DNA-binding protein [Bacteroidales bacterium]MDY4228776.1 HU family DNA-binding protein [Prevotella sp.]